jgi:hypothetical protein
MLTLPSRGEKRTRALERVAGQLLAALGADPNEVGAKKDVLTLLKARSAKVQTKWGFAEAPDFTGVLETEEWTVEGAIRWLREYSARIDRKRQRSRQVLEERVADYLSTIIDEDVKGVEHLIALLDRASSKSPTPEITYIEDDVTFTFKSVMRYFRQADAETINRIITSTNRNIEHKKREEEKRLELEEYLQDIGKAYGVEVYVDELAEHGHNLFGVKIYIDDSASILDFTCSFDELKKELGGLVKEEAEAISNDYIVCPFCGVQERRNHVMKQDHATCSCGARIVHETVRDMEGWSKELEELWGEGCSAVGLPVPERWRRLYIDNFFENVKYVGRGVTNWRMWFVRMPWTLKVGVDIAEEPLPSVPEALDAVGKTLVKQRGFKYFEWNPEASTPMHEYVKEWGIEKEESWGRIAVTYDEYIKRFEVGFKLGLFDGPEYEKACEDYDGGRIDDPYEALCGNLDDEIERLTGLEHACINPDDEEDTEFAVTVDGENYDEAATRIMAAIDAVERNVESILEREKVLLRSLYDPNLSQRCSQCGEQVPLYKYRGHIEAEGERKLEEYRFDSIPLTEEKFKEVAWKMAAEHNVDSATSERILLENLLCHPEAVRTVKEVKAILESPPCEKVETLSAKALSIMPEYLRRGLLNRAAAGRRLKRGAFKRILILASSVK